MSGKTDVSSETNDAPNKIQCEVKITEARYRKDGERKVNRIRDLGGLKHRDEVYAVDVHYEFNDKHLLESTTLTINSPHILAAFTNAIVSHPSVPADFSKPFTMESPFQMLLHHWDDLTDYRDRLQNDEARMHVNVLLEFMDVDLGDEKRELDAMMAAGHVRYKTLWAIFRPGDIAVEHVGQQPWLLKVQKTAYEENTQIGPYFEVHCVYTDFDGTDFGEAARVTKIVQKRSFGQENPSRIASLPIFPTRYLDRSTDIKLELTERGRKFLQYTEMSVQYYDGFSEYLKDFPPSYFHWDMGEFPLIWLPFAETGRVIVDRKPFQEDVRPALIQRKMSRCDVDSSLCPPFLYGYSLNRKEWCRFYIANIRDAGWKDNAFDTLILPESKLQLIHALVSSHKAPSNSRDQSAQKGKGLVILLHGEPGSGKTLTAECAAEETRRALLSTTLPELNKYDSTAYFEFQLKGLLRLASVWNAVVLFDEADVFLQTDGDSSSGNSASKRNTLIAIFLRQLEYFSGIAFLTTNRVQAFDGAMKSRIHLALEYPAQDVESRRRIWANTLSSIPAEERALDVDEVSYLWADDNFNGRQITNAVRTATTLARSEKVPLHVRHIDAIIGMWKEFDVKPRSFSAETEVNGDHPARRGLITPQEFKK